MSLFSRRRLLIGGATIFVLGGAAVGGSLAFCGRRGTAQAQRQAASSLFAALDRRYGAEGVGHAYLAAEGAPALWAAFDARTDLHQVALWDCADTRRAHLERCFRADFARGDSLVVDRWVVSRSEALIAGLAAAGTA